MCRLWINSRYDPPKRTPWQITGSPFLLTVRQRGMEQFGLAEHTYLVYSTGLRQPSPQCHTTTVTVPHCRALFFHVHLTQLLDSALASDGPSLSVHCSSTWLSSFGNSCEAGIAQNDTHVSLAWRSKRRPPGASRRSAPAHFIHPTVVTSRPTTTTGGFL